MLATGRTIILPQEWKLASTNDLSIRCNRGNFFLPPRSKNWLLVTTGEDAKHNDTLLCGSYKEPFSLVVHGNQSELALHYTDTYRYSDGFSVWYLGLDGPLIGTVHYIKQINQSIYSIRKELH